MADLAERAFSSRSGMTRRIDRLEEESLVVRTQPDEDGRGVVVGLSEGGARRLAELAHVHSRGVRRLFVERLEEAEIVALEVALQKVCVDTSFG